MVEAQTNIEEKLHQILTDKATASQLRTGKVTRYLFVVLFSHLQIISWSRDSCVGLQLSRDLANPASLQCAAAETLRVGSEAAARWNRTASDPALAELDFLHPVSMSSLIIPADLSIPLVD